MLEIKLYPLPLTWLESSNPTIKGMMEENSWKNRSNWYHVRQIVQLDWSKTAKHFSVNSCGKFTWKLTWKIEASRQASKQVNFSHEADTRYFSYFWAVISAMYVVLFILGKCLLYSYQLLLIFTEVWLYNFFVSHDDFQMACFFLHLTSQLVSVKNKLLQCFMETS